jgi:hypothetical protein
MGEMSKKTFKLVLQLDSENDNVVLNAARKLVNNLKANGSDLRMLADALAAEWEKQQKPKSKPVKVDYSAVDAAIKGYAADRTEVRFNALWKAILKAVPAIDSLRGTDEGPRVHGYIIRYMKGLGFTASASGLTFHRA